MYTRLTHLKLMKKKLNFKSRKKRAKQIWFKTIVEAPNTIHQGNAVFTLKASQNTHTCGYYLLLIKALLHLKHLVCMCVWKNKVEKARMLPFKGNLVEESKIILFEFD
uniref:(northern house mosquito) hypothetical protein n=1 Tax=Culex pipiens TaxID=7175 RepID=A0A8D8JBJ5_CULPI